MTDQQAVEILQMIETTGLSLTARNISIKRIKAMMKMDKEVKALWTTGHKYYVDGFEACKRAVLKILEDHRKE